MNRKRFLIMPAVLILAVLACNLPSAPETAPSNDAAAATITALAATIQAQQGGPASGNAPANTPTDTPLPSDTPTVTPTPTITLTPTPSVPMVTVSQTTNCRTGPGTEYDLIGALSPGQSAQVVGKMSYANYWVINNPGGNGSCWLWGQYASVSGDTSGLPEMTAPPTPTPSLPARPDNFKASVSCTSGGFFLFKVHVNLSWADLATNEDGYYLFRNGDLLVTLGANVTSFSDDTTLPKLVKLGDPPPSVSYSVQAFNGAGKSKKRDLQVSCP